MVVYYHVKVYLYRSAGLVGGGRCGGAGGLWLRQHEFHGKRGVSGRQRRLRREWKQQQLWSRGVWSFERQGRGVFRGRKWRALLQRHHWQLRHDPHPLEDEPRLVCAGLHVFAEHPGKGHG